MYWGWWWPPKRRCTQKVKLCKVVKHIINCDVLKLESITFSKILFLFIISSLFLPHPVHKITSFYCELDSELQVQQFSSTGICNNHKTGCYWRSSSPPEVVNHLLGKPLYSQLENLQHCEQIYMKSTLGKRVVCYGSLCLKSYIRY